MGNGGNDRSPLTVRDAFFNRIFELIQRSNDIIVVTPDLGAPSLDALREFYPERYISTGIAEQNMISVASGLALTGKRVVAYGLGPFPVTRAFDQIRCLLAEMDIPVTVCILNAGLCSAECGYTHMPVEDMGMLRMLPNIRIFNPTDETVARRLADSVLVAAHPQIIRFDKYLRGVIYQEEEVDWSKGFAEYGTPGGLAVVSCGKFVPELRQTADEMTAAGYATEVIDLYSVPTGEEQLLSVVSSCKAVLTVEENVLAGGIGAYILELFNERNISVPVKRMGLHPGCHHDVYADRAYIRHNEGLDAESIIQSARSLMQKAGAY